MVVHLSGRSLGVLVLLIVGACVRAGFEPLPAQDSRARDSRARDSVFEGAHPDLSTGDLPQGSLCEIWGDTALFCEDMDSPSGQLPQSLAFKNATGTLDTSRYFAGLASLRIATQTSANADPFVLLDSPFSTTTITSGTVYLRAHYYFDAVPNIPEWSILMESRAHATTANKIVVELGPAGKVTLGRTGGHAAESTQLPVGSWFCLELEVTVGSAGGARMWIDGQLVTQLTGVDTDQGVGHDLFRAGIIVASNTPPLTLNVDDFLVTQTRVGCP
jgi:hypothetical protein